MAFLDLFAHLKWKKLLEQAQSAEAAGELEKAYELYVQASEMGCAAAMTAIGNLYMQKGFRMVKTSNLLELMAMGMPVFPWNLQEQEVPDMKSALEWFRKAADAGDVQGMLVTGSLMCEGQGCPENIEGGLDYLKKAADRGDLRARKMMALFSKPRQEDVPEEQYSAWLEAFEKAVDGQEDKQFALYENLKRGCPAQWTRLGRLLTAARNIERPGYGLFKYLYDEKGIPLIPASVKRGAWQSFVRIDLNAFPEEDVLIAFSADIQAKFCLDERHRLREAGTAVYRSPAFGWLGEEKEAVVFRIDREALLSGERLEKVMEDFRLTEEEYAPDNAAFFTERGEKEYSAEVAAICGSRVEVLLRYTIGGSEQVKEYFEPALVSLTLKQ